MKLLYNTLKLKKKFFCYLQMVLIENSSYFLFFAVFNVTLFVILRILVEYQNKARYLSD